MAEDKKTKPQPPKPTKAEPVNKGKATAPAKAVVVVDPQKPTGPVTKSQIDQLEELTKIDLDNLGDLDTGELRKKMLQGVYLLEHVLFSQAGYEFKRIEKLRGLIGLVEKEIFDESKFKQMSESEKLRLYRMMMANMTQSMEFMNNLHKNVTLGIEAVNSIDRIKADKGYMAGAPEDVIKDDVENVRALIMEKIAKKLRDPNARTEVVRVQGKPAQKPKKAKKKKPKPKKKIQTPAASVPKEEPQQGSGQ